MVLVSPCFKDGPVFDTVGELLIFPSCLLFRTAGAFGEEEKVGRYGVSTYEADPLWRTIPEQPRPC